MPSGLVPTEEVPISESARSARGSRLTPQQKSNTSAGQDTAVGSQGSAGTGQQLTGENTQVYQQLLQKLTHTDSEGSSAVSMDRMADIRRRLTEFQLHYKFGMDEVLTKINVLREEFEHTRDYSPIEHVNYRLKTLDRIIDKVQRYGIEASLEAIKHAIRDIAGVRITCSFVSDAYWVAEMLYSQPDLRVVQVKDYIASPKPNGYRSLHLILQVPVFLSNRTEFVYVEVQIRTVAMDFWASLEHKIYYTYEGEVPNDILDELRDAAIQATALDAQMAEIRDKVTALQQQAPQSGPPASAAGADEPAGAGEWFSAEPQSEEPAWTWDEIVRRSGPSD